MEHNESDIVDFVCIGAMKAGTTTLFTSLQPHKDILLTKKKEANFFNNEIDPVQLAIYNDSFTAGTGVRADVSPNYSLRHISPQTAARLAKYAPNAKIIYIVRDPIKRLISHLHHDLYRARFDPEEAFEKASDPNGTYVLTSSYNYQLEAYERFFSSDQIMVVSFENLIGNFAATFSEIMAYVGSKSAKPIEVHPGNLTSKRYKIPYHDFIHSRVKNNHLLNAYHRFWSIVNIKIDKPSFTDEQMCEVASLLQADTKILVDKYPTVSNKWSAMKKFTDL